VLETLTQGASLREGAPNTDTLGIVTQGAPLREGARNTETLRTLIPSVRAHILLIARVDGVYESPKRIYPIAAWFRRNE
jgi:hypothetical protein